MSEVTERFVATLRGMKKEGVISSFRQFALSVDYLPQSVSEIINGRRDVSLEVLRKSIALYNMNPVFLFTGDGPPFITNEVSKDGRFQTIVTDHNHQKKVIFIPKDIPNSRFEKRIILKQITFKPMHFKSNNKNCICNA